MRILPILIILAVLVSPAFAHTDPAPKVYITAPSQVDTDAGVRVFAEDLGYKSGLVYVALLEDGKEIARKYCDLTNQCEISLNVHHDLKGRHSYAGVAMDRSDNRKIEIAGVMFLGFDQPPVLTFEEKPYAEEGYSLHLFILASDKNKYPITVTTSKLPKGAVFDGQYLIWTPDYDQAGNYAITFTAVNSKNLKTTRTMHITVKNMLRSPQIISVSPDSEKIRVFEGEKATFNMETFDPDKTMAKTEWLLDNKKVSSSRTYTYKPDYKSSGLHILVGRVYNDDYTKRHVWEITVENVNRPPVMSQIAAKKIKEGQMVKFSVSAKSSDSNPLTYKVLSLPAGATFDSDTRSFEWQTRNSQAGIYDIVFSATDPEGFTDSKTATITVTKEDVDPDFEKLYDEYDAAAKKTASQDRAVVTTGVTPGITTNNFYQYQQNTATCASGYLCYSVSYLTK